MCEMILRSQQIWQLSKNSQKKKASGTHLLIDHLIPPSHFIVPLHSSIIDSWNLCLGVRENLSDPCAYREKLHIWPEQVVKVDVVLNENTHSLLVVVAYVVGDGKATGKKGEKVHRAKKESRCLHKLHQQFASMTTINSWTTTSHDNHSHIW